MIPI
jgi:hypothetical protein